MTRSGGFASNSGRRCATSSRRFVQSVVQATSNGRGRVKTARICIVARTWLSIRVDLVEGGGRSFWPRPGRILAAARTHTFADLAEAIDDAFARWDRAHLYEFRLLDGTRIGLPEHDWCEEACLDGRRTKLSRLETGADFLYVFDFGDGWHHLCTVGKQRIDPLDELGIVPTKPLPHWGWGEIPDQYGRRWAEDDGESAVPPNPRRTDLPPFFPSWGSGADRYPD